VIDLSAFNTILSRLEGVADRLEQGTSAIASAGPSAAPPAAAAAEEEDAPIAVAYAAFIKEKTAVIEAAVAEVGSQDVADATGYFVEVLRLLKSILSATGKCKKPKDTDWGKFWTPVLEVAKKASDGLPPRSNEWFPHRKALADALGVSSMVMMPSPGDHVQNVLEEVDFHAIKVMQRKNPPETAWIQAVKTTLKDLVTWCKENCKMGLTWSASGEDPVEYFAAKPMGSAAPAPAAKAPAKGKGKGKAPAVPKGGFAAKPKEEEGAAPAPSSGGGAAEVFNAINGFDTSKLKKVTADMKTKNRPKEDVVSAVPAKAAPAPAPKAAAAKGKGPRGPPKKELVKSNWYIENYEGVSDLTLEEATMSQLVCIINCKNITLRMPAGSKVKSVNIDGCEKVNVIMHDVVSAVELVNSDRCQVQTTGKVNTFSVDKCKGVNIFLSKDSLEAELVTSMSCEMNVTVPDPDGDEFDVIEMPIPEQFVTKLAGKKKLKTEVSSLYS